MYTQSSCVGQPLDLAVLQYGHKCRSDFLIGKVPVQPVPFSVLKLIVASWQLNSLTAPTCTDARVESFAFHRQPLRILLRFKSSLYKGLVREKLAYQNPTSETGELDVMWSCEVYSVTSSSP